MFDFGDGHVRCSLALNASAAEVPVPLVRTVLVENSACKNDR